MKRSLSNAGSAVPISRAYPAPSRTVHAPTREDERTDLGGSRHRCRDPKSPSYQLETATSGSGVEKRYYQCRSYVRIGKAVCPDRRIPVEVLGRAVLNHVGEQLFTEERCKEILRDFVEEQGSLRKQAEDRRRVLVRERDDIERRLARW
jgi:hypothetical protein